MWFSFPLTHRIRVGMPWWLGLPLFLVVVAIDLTIFLMAAIIFGIAFAISGVGWTFKTATERLERRR